MKPAGVVFNRAFAQASTVYRCDKKLIDWMVRRHYLGKWPGVVVTRLVMVHDCRTVGMVVFALPPSQTFKRYGGEVWELARLWVCDSMPPNTESWLVAQAIKIVRRDNPRLVALVSYADPSKNHVGIIYKASNWVADGMTDDDRSTPRFDYRFNGKIYSRCAHIPRGIEVERVPRVSKYRFVYWLAGATRG